MDKGKEGARPHTGGRDW